MDNRNRKGYRLGRRPGQQGPRLPSGNQDGGDKLTTGTNQTQRAPRATPPARKSLRMATWNVLTLAQEGYAELVAKQMVKYRIDIAGFTEARIPGSDLTAVGNSTLLHSGGATRHQGVALLLSQPMGKALMSWTPISPRLLTARLRHKRCALFIVVAYAPTEQADMQTKDAFYDQLSAALSAAPPHDELFILGDLNAVTGSDHTLFPGVVGKYGSEASLNDNSERMLSFARRTVWLPSVLGSGGRLSGGGLGSQMMAELEKS